MNGKLSLLLTVVCVILVASGQQVAGAGGRISKRASGSPASHNPHDLMHSHLSRKVFERACKANKDTIDDIVACLHNNEHLMKAIKGEIAGDCYKEAFGVSFNPDETTKHKDLICNNRDKFEEMTACAYRKTAEAVDAKEIERLTEALVDVGFCIIDALDG